MTLAEEIGLWSSVIQLISHTKKTINFGCSLYKNATSIDPSAVRLLEATKAELPTLRQLVQQCSADAYQSPRLIHSVQHLMDQLATTVAELQSTLDKYQTEAGEYKPSLAQSTSIVSGDRTKIEDLEKTLREIRLYMLQQIDLLDKMDPHDGRAAEARRAFEEASNRIGHTELGMQESATAQESATEQQGDNTNG